MTLALFEAFTAKPPVIDTEIEENPRSFAKKLSIQAHLVHLLNARRGSIVHMPDYGLPDVSELYAELPYSQQYLVAAVTQAITKYEPRLKKVSVHVLEKRQLDCVLSLEIRAEINKGEKLSYGLLFESGGGARVLD